MRPHRSGHALAQAVPGRATEPDLTTRARLCTELATTAIHHHVIDDLNDIPDGSVNLALITNVLHELTPPSIGALLETAARKVIPGTGRVIILELYPLLAVEYYAVPYQCADLTDILAASGFTYNEQTYPLRGKLTTAACIIPRQRDRSAAATSPRASENTGGS